MPKTELMTAIEKNNSKRSDKVFENVKKIVLEKNANVNEKSTTDVYYSEEESPIQISPLIAACANEWANQDVIKFLINQGAKVTELDPNRQTTLMLLSRCKFPLTEDKNKTEEFAKKLIANMQLLITGGVDPNATIEGFTTLMMAVAPDDEDHQADPVVVDFLLKQKGVLVNAKNNEGETALDIAITKDVSFRQACVTPPFPSC